MSLGTLQSAFWRAVRYDPSPPDALEHFVGDDRLGAAERMAVYRNMYWFRQVDALGESFPKLRERLGLERFTKLCCRYIRKHPSEHPALERLGRELPTFLAEHAPEHAGLARLEWARLVALIAPDPVSIVGIADVDPATFSVSRLVFVSSLDVVEVDAASLAAFDGQASPPHPGPIAVAVWRRGFHPRHLALAADEAAALSCARRGATIAEVLATFPADELGIQSAFALLRGWLSRQWVQALEVPLP